MNRVMKFSILSLCFAAQILTATHARGEVFTSEKAEKIRESATSAFVSHKYGRSYDLFGDYCRHFPGDSNQLQDMIDKSLAYLQTNSKVKPERLKKLRGYLNGLVGLTAYTELRAVTDPEPQSK